MRVPFAVPECNEDEIQEVADVIRSGWLTTASRCAQFERDFAAFIGVKHALAVNSATAALHLGLESLGIGEGDCILVPTLTFTATAEIVRYLGADPIFVDCDPETFCMTLDQIEKVINARGLRTSDLKGIIPVHFGGHPCEIDAILEFAREQGMNVMEDVDPGTIVGGVPAKLIGRY